MWARSAAIDLERWMAGDNRSRKVAVGGGDVNFSETWYEEL